ncbi:MAG: XRE family transcriptional regulator [Acidobacteria bacterium]|nr:XRE family transcriptional regulator [Acidobacteriota bacterium]
MTQQQHWTQQSIEAFRYRITNDFIMQLEKKMDTERITQKDLATRLGLTAGRVSQILNGATDNFSLEKIIEYAQALEMKVSLVAYEDGDPRNTRGPIDADIFYICWERQGKPKNYFDLNGDETEALSDLDMSYIEASTPIGNVIRLSDRVATSAVTKGGLGTRLGVSTPKPAEKAA